MSPALVPGSTPPDVGVQVTAHNQAGMIREAVDFLARNACPADVMVRRSAWERAGGYDESLRSGFEDWDFFLRLLGDSDDARISVVPEELIDYRTARASANVSSMEERTSLLRGLVSRHRNLYLRHIDELVTSFDALATLRLHAWEDLAVASGAQVPAEASFGDGGMTSVVRIASARAGTDPQTPGH